MCIAITAAALAACAPTKPTKPTEPTQPAPAKADVADPATPPPAPSQAAVVTPPAPSVPPAAPAITLRETFPGLRVDVANKVLEFDAEVPIDAQGERVYLEVLVCTPNTREHETLVVTKVKPSHIHATLLLMGLKEGTPPRWDFDGTNLTPVAPTGPRVEVFLREAGQPASDNKPIADFVTNIANDKSLATHIRAGASSPDHLVFAGSRFVDNIYAADMDGTIVGLTAFGGETIAWTAMYHPDTDRMTPEWIADGRKLPKFRTKMIVTIVASN
jgi:hypothetical protein